MMILSRFLRSAFLSVILLICASVVRASASETQPLQTSTTTVSVLTVVSPLGSTTSSPTPQTSGGVPGSVAVSSVPLTDLEQAQDFLRQGKNQEANSLFERIMASSPSAPGVLEGLAEAQLALGNISKAETSVGKILGRDKQDPAGWVLLARAAYARGNYGKTLSYCKKALKYESHYSPAYFWRGKAYEARGEADEAKNEYHAATLCNQK